MINPIIIRTVARLYMYVIPLFSVFLLLKGHNEPGGGFIAGLMMAAAIVIQAMAFDADYAANMIPIRESVLLATGLALAAVTGLVGIIVGESYLFHLFTNVTIPMFGTVQLSTAVIFDVGVYLVVIGATKWIILTLSEEEEG